jgi:hypothetical protein
MDLFNKIATCADISNDPTGFLTASNDAPARIRHSNSSATTSETLSGLSMGQKCPRQAMADAVPHIIWQAYPRAGRRHACLQYDST